MRDSGSRSRRAALVWMTSLLAACSGGGDDEPAPPPALSGTATLEATLDVLVPASITAQWNGPAGSSPRCALVSGSLPAGMALSNTCVLSGAPTEAGSFSPRITVTAAGYSGSVSVNGQLTVAGPMLGVPASPAGTGLQVGSAVSDLPVVGVSYSAPFGPRAGDVLAYRITAGTLPAGLGLDAATGLLSGTPTQEESRTFSIGATLTRDGANYTLAPFSVTLSIGPAPVDMKAEGVYIRTTPDAFDAWVLVRADGTVWWIGGNKVPSSQGAAAGTRFLPTDLATGKASPAAGTIAEFPLTAFTGAPLMPVAITWWGTYDPLASRTLSLPLGIYAKPDPSAYTYETSMPPLGTVTLQSLMTGGAPVTVTLTFQPDGAITGTRVIDGNDLCGVSGYYVPQQDRNFVEVRLSQECFDGGPGGAYAGVAWVHRYTYEGSTQTQVLMPMIKTNRSTALLLVSP